MIESPRDVTDRFAELYRAFVPVARQITDDPPPAQVDNIRAVLDGIATDTRALIRDLDGVDELDFALVDDGERTIALWTWRRSTRRALLQFAGGVRAAREVADDLIGGTRQKVIVTRQGETLQRIAQRELGDWRAWPRLLAANPGVEAGELPSGISLVIPTKR